MPWAEVLSVPKRSSSTTPGNELNVAWATRGVNTHRGKITFKAVAESQNKPYTPLSDLL
jgi:hypothetical protein